MRRHNFLTLTILTSLLLGGCGGPDPLTKEQRELHDKAQPEKARELGKQEIPSVNLITLAPDAKHKTPLTFITGVQKIYVLKSQIQLDDPNVDKVNVQIKPVRPLKNESSSLKPMTLPNAMFKPVPQLKNTWNFQWTPDLNFVETYNGPELQHRDQIDIRIAFEIDVSQDELKKVSPVTQNKIKKALEDNNIRELEIKVFKNNESPKIMSISLPRVINYGEAHQFDIEINAKGASTDNPPYIVPIDGWPRGLSPIRSARHSGQGDTWNASYVFDTSLIKLKYPEDFDNSVLYKDNKRNFESPIPDPSVKVGEDFSFKVQAIRESAKRHTPVSYRFKVLYETPEPKINLPNSPTNTRIGSDLKMNFTVASDKGMGVIQAQPKYSTQASSGWPGKPELKCDLDTRDYHTQNCELTWSVPCESTQGEYTLHLEAQNELNENTNVTSADHKIQVNTEANTNCPADKEETAEPTEAKSVTESDADETNNLSPEGAENE